jgi:hypothetical protein
VTEAVTTPPGMVIKATVTAAGSLVWQVIS